MGAELQGSDWYQQQQLEEERYRMTVDALNRCAAKGANPEDLKFIGKELGIDTRHINVGEGNAKN